MKEAQRLAKDDKLSTGCKATQYILYKFSLSVTSKKSLIGADNKNRGAGSKNILG